MSIHGSRGRSSVPAIRRLTTDKGLRVSIELAPQLTRVPPQTEAQLRLDAHKAKLAAWGAASLSDLGKLAISGNVIPSAGLTIPTLQTTPSSAGNTTFQSAFRIV